MIVETRNAAGLHRMKRTSEQHLAFAAMADPRVLNEIIRFPVRAAQLPKAGNLAPHGLQRNAHRNRGRRSGGTGSGAHVHVGAHVHGGAHVCGGAHAKVKGARSRS